MAVLYPGIKTASFRHLYISQSGLTQTCLHSTGGSLWLGKHPLASQQRWSILQLDTLRRVI